MNNSSANNFLLRSVQGTTAPTPAPKRNYQDDQPAGFQQNFKDIHDSVRTEHQPPIKPVAKKTTTNTNDNRQPAVAQEKKPAESKPTSEASQLNQISDEEQDVTSAKNGAPATTDTELADPKVEHKCADKKQIQSDELVATSDANLSLQAQIASPALPESSTASEILVGNTNTAASNVEPTSVEISPTAVAPATTNRKVSDEVSDSSDKKSKSLVDSSSAKVEPDAALILSSTESSQPLQQPAVTQDVMVEQNPSAVVIPGQVQLAKPATSSVLAQADMQDSADETGFLTSAVLDEKPVVKTVSSTQATPVLANADTTKGGGLEEPKATFEKMLQNLTQPEPRMKDDSFAQPAPAPATSSSSPGLDSLMRFSDSNTPAARSFVVQTAVPVPVGQPQWSQAVGDKVLWLAAQNVSSAEINLNPEHLGPMQVKVSVNQEQTSVSFTSHHVVVREVLDQNLGRLRDMFSEQGLNLVNVDVSDKSFSRQQGEPQNQSGQAANKEQVVEDEVPVAVSSIKQQRLVDHYA